MSSLPAAKKRQLNQLQKFDPLAYRRANALLKCGYTASASMLISMAMKALLKRFAASPPAAAVDDLYQQLDEWIKTQPVIQPRQEVKIREFRGQPVRVRRDQKNELRLRVGAKPSVYVGFWGSDDSHISSRAGAWKISSQARENLGRVI